MHEIGHNGSPPLVDDVPHMNFVKFYPGDFLNGVAHMSLELRGAYITALCIMYDRMGGMPYDEREGGVLLRVDRRVYRRVRDLLLADGKFYLDGSMIRNSRVEREISNYVKEYIRRSEAAKKREAEKAKRSGTKKTSAELLPDFPRTSAELPPDFSRTSPELEPKKPIKSKDDELYARALLEARSQKLEARSIDISDSPNGESSPRAEDAGPTEQVLPLALEGDEPFDAKAFNRRLTETAFEDYLDLARRVGLTEHKPSTLKQLRSDIVRRMREHAADPQSFESMIGVWREALRKIEISAFLQGDNPRGWKADLNFLCQKSSFRKVYDGGYGNGAHAKPRQPGEVSEAEREATLRRYAALAGGSW